MVDGMIEHRISIHRLAILSEDAESAVKELSRKFAQSLYFDFEYEYYSLKFTQENWMLATLADPRTAAFIQGGEYEQA